MEQKVHNLEISMAEFKKDIKYLKEGQDRHDANLKEIKTDQKEILGKIDDNATKMDEFIQSSTDRFVDKKYHAETMAKIDTLIACQDNKYSLKWVESFIVWAARIIGTAILLAFATLIGKVYLHLF